MQPQDDANSTHSESAPDNLTNMFLIGPAGLSPNLAQPMSDEELAVQIQLKHEEEKEWWKGDLVNCVLSVELPFRLIIDNGEVDITHEATTTKATIRNDFLEVSHGPIATSSRTNVAYVGPKKSMTPVVIRSLVPNGVPICREMRTVILFDARAMKDAFIAISQIHEIHPSDYPQTRRANRSFQYLNSLAYAHIPFLNNLISAYRAASSDPFATQVSEWDVPVWFAEDGDHLIRIGLMPYWNSDTPINLGDEGESGPHATTTMSDIKKHIVEGVSPGKMELLDAFSLYYRGRYEDSVRSAVTAIEVSLEAQYKELLQECGRSTEDTERIINSTRNNFYERLRQYEKLSGRRVPGPIISLIPYINGLRLKDEIDRSRSLRHKIVHQGARVSVSQRGPMQRIIETTTWVYDWLNYRVPQGYPSGDNYALYESLRGRADFPFEYTATGVSVLPFPWTTDDTYSQTTDEVLATQFASAIEPESRDLELFARMSLARIGIPCDEGPPSDEGIKWCLPRYFAKGENLDTPVFISEVDGVVDSKFITTSVASLVEYAQNSGHTGSMFLIIDHQRKLPLKRRRACVDVDATSRELLRTTQIGMITTVDLYRLVEWSIDSAPKQSVVRLIMSLPGWHGVSPPGYQQVGVAKRFLPKLSVVSIELHEGKEIRIGDTIVIRLKDRWYEQCVESLQVEGNNVTKAIGPDRVGLVVAFLKSDFAFDAQVFHYCE